MITVTHPYGTTRRGTVVDVIGRTQFITDDRQEGHILMCGAGDATAQMGDTGILTFIEGGPTGGYWKFTKDVQWLLCAEAEERSGEV